jgi:serine protease AprX
MGISVRFLHALTAARQRRGELESAFIFPGDPMNRVIHPLRCLAPSALALACAGAFAAQVDSDLPAIAAKEGKVDVLIVLQAQAQKQLLRNETDVLQRRRDLVHLLRATAETSQRDLVTWLDNQGIEYRPYWIVNAVQATVTPTQLDALAARGEIARIAGNRPMRVNTPAADVSPSGAALPVAPAAIEWGVSRVRAPEVWATGIRGQGVVVAGQDTGIRWDHASIKTQYRGWTGTTADHNYNWHDAVHTGGGSCGANTVAPCDDHNHGTHTVGTMVGYDGGSNEIGVAPDAQWIGCRNMNVGDGSPATYIECTQWLMAPTDSSGANPEPDLAPDIVNNSWGCVPSEGCTTGLEIREAIENIIDAGVFFVVAAGNDGGSCGTIADAPAMYDISFTVGGIASSGSMYSSSSRGPVAGLAMNKPDLIAPAVSVRSALRNGAYGTMTGTSMAAPHVAGVAALLMSVNPSLKGQPERIAEILRSTAVPITTSSQVCGGIPATTIPNPVQGYGEIDAWRAFRVAETIFVTDFDEK